MQKTLSKASALTLAAALCLTLSVAIGLQTAEKAYAADKIDIGEASYVDLKVNGYDKKGYFKDYAAYKNGKAVKPKVTVYAMNWDTGKQMKLKAGTDYTVAYKNNKKIGTASVIVKGKGKYSGTTTASFQINPQLVKKVKAAGAKKGVKLSWKTLPAKQADGYSIVIYDKKGNAVKTLNVYGSKTSSATVKGLKAKTGYTASVSAFKVTCTIEKYDGTSYAYPSLCTGAPGYKTFKTK